jgi:hypothetical protein
VPIRAIRVFPSPITHRWLDFEFVRIRAIRVKIPVFLICVHLLVPRSRSGEAGWFRIVRIRAIRVPLSRFASFPPLIAPASLLENPF